MHAFGVANFEFNLKEKVDSLTVYDFIAELKARLDELHNIESIEINYDESRDDEEIIFIPPTGLLSDDGYNPGIPFFDLKFDLYIPYRVQGAFLTDLGFQYMANESIEHFRVNIKDQFYSMVTHVEMLGATRESEPADGVIIVREYLHKYFNSLGSFIIFHSIGPSPFHANFYIIKTSEKKEKDIGINWIEKPGYNDLEIFIYNNALVTVDCIYDEMHSELALFYSLITTRNYFMHEWHDITHKLDNLINLDSYKIKILNHIRRKKLIGEMLKRLWIFKAEGISTVGDNATMYNDVYTLNREFFYIQKFVDREMNNKQEYPIDDTKELVKFHEEKSSKSFELLVNFTTALLGALVGVFFAK